MKRRAFVSGTATSFVLPAGCLGGDTAGSEPSSESTEPASTDTAWKANTGTPGRTIEETTTPPTPESRTTNPSATRPMTAEETEPTATRPQSKPTAGDAPHVGKFVLQNDDNDSHTIAISVIKGRSKLLQETYELGPGFSVGIANPITKQGTYRIRVATESRLTTTYVWEITTCGTDEFLQITINEKSAIRFTELQRTIIPTPTCSDLPSENKSTISATKERTPPSTNRKETTDPSTQTRGSCPLVNDVTHITTPVTPTESTLRFEDLSEKGKQLFLKARNNDQSVFVYDTSKKPPEFQYTDERRCYVIIQDGTKYQLFTYTNAGCSFPAETDS
jgi:hypothetical protein